jgi:hypothetical protein
MIRRSASHASTGRSYPISRGLELAKRPNAAQSLYVRNLLDLILNKEQRATVAALSTVIGLAMIGGYYLGIGETPDVSLGQATLLVLEAFVVGVLCVVGLCLATFSPALVFHLSDIDVDAVFVANRKQLLPLFVRSLVAQIGGIAFAAISILSPTPGALFIVWISAIVVVIVTAVSFLFSPKIKGESHLQYWISVLVTGFYGVFSMGLAIVIYQTVQDRVSEWRLFSAMIFLVVASAALSLVGLTRWKAKAAGMFISIVIMMAILDSASFVFRFTAYKIGIARSQPATLTLPKEACFSLKPLLRKSVVDCTSEITVLDHVRVLSSLGERWVIRERESNENISFVAKGVGIRDAAK